MQILIYGGAIVIVLIFAIMLTRNAEYPRTSDNRSGPLRRSLRWVCLGVLVPAFLINAVRGTSPSNAAFTDIGISLFTTWAVPFEIASLVLLVALIGAIIIARSGRERASPWSIWSGFSY